MAAFYPELIIFHAHGGHRVYKNMRMFRWLTAADIILQDRRWRR
jgi:hypothetical protein